MSWPGYAKPDGSYTYVSDWLNYWMARCPQLADLVDANVTLQHGDWIDAAETPDFPIVLPDLGKDAEGHSVNRLSVLGLLNSLIYNTGMVVVATVDEAGHTTRLATMRRAEFNALRKASPGPEGQSSVQVPHPGVAIAGQPAPTPFPPPAMAPAHTVAMVHPNRPPVAAHPFTPPPIPPEKVAELEAHVRRQVWQGAFTGHTINENALRADYMRGLARSHMQQSIAQHARAMLPARPEDYTPKD